MRCMDNIWIRCLADRLAITDPEYLAGCQCHLCIKRLIDLTTDQVMPAINTNQIDVSERKFLWLRTDIGDAKNTLAAVHALSPETKQRIPKLQGKLCGIGVKGCLLTTDPDQLLELFKYLVVMRPGVGQ